MHVCVCVDAELRWCRQINACRDHSKVYMTAYTLHTYVTITYNVSK